MAHVSVDIEDEGPVPDPTADAGAKGKRRRPVDVDPIEIEVEREITKRHLIEAISSIVVVILYMAFTLLRDRDAGVVVLDERDKGAADDWDES